MIGRIQSVTDEVASTDLTANAASSATSITVTDPSMFNELGGNLIITDGVNTDTVAYTAVNMDTGVMTVAALPHAYTAVDTVVKPTNGTVVRWAEVNMEASDDEIDATAVAVRVPNVFLDRLPIGTRGTNDGEWVLIERQGDDLVVVDFPGETPVIDGGFIDPTTLTVDPTDGSPPASSPTPSLQGGVGYMLVKWTPVANHDPVTYEVHISASTGFTAGPTTLAGEVSGSLFFIRRMPDNSALLYQTIYYVKIIAKDFDGAAAVSAEANGMLVQASSADISVGSITVDQILAGSITAEALEAMLVMATTLVAGVPTGSRVEIGKMTNLIDPDGISVYGADGSLVGSIASDGTVHFGEMTVGTLYSDNVVTADDAPIRLYVDAENGDDQNDGLTPVAFTDNFTRTTANGWGAASDGKHTWVKGNGTAANFTTVTATSDAKYAAAASDFSDIFCGAGDISSEILVKVKCSPLPTGGITLAGPTFYGRDSKNYYGIALVAPITAITPKLRIIKKANNTQTVLVNDQALTGDTAIILNNTYWWIRAQVFRNPGGLYGGQTVIRAKAWRAANTEPTNWDQSIVDSDPYLNHSGGSWGMYFNSAAALSNAPIWSCNSFSASALDEMTIDDTSAAGTTGANIVGTGILPWAPASSTGPLATIGEAISRIPLYFNGMANIILAPQTVIYEDLTIVGLVGGGEIYVHGAGEICGGSWNGTCSWAGLAAFFRITGAAFNDQGGGETPFGAPLLGTIFASSSRHIEIFASKIQTNAAKAYSLLGAQGSEVHIEACQIDGATSTAVMAQEGAIVYGTNCFGSETPSGNAYRAQAGGIIIWEGTAPTGNVGTGIGGVTMNGRQYMAGGVLQNTGVTSGSAGTAATPITKTTTVWDAQDSASYANAGSTGWRAGDEVIQGTSEGTPGSPGTAGYWTWNGVYSPIGPDQFNNGPLWVWHAGSSGTSGTPGNRYIGIWKYANSLQSVLSGKTIDNGFITLRRRSSGGAGKPQNIYIASLNRHGIGGADPAGTIVSGPTLIGAMRWGDVKTLHVPNSILNDLKAAVGGESRSLGVYQSDGDPYVVLLGVNHFKHSGQLKITWH